MKFSRTVCIVAGLASASQLVACLSNSDEEADTYRAALPLQESVSVGGPDATAAATTASASTAAPEGAPLSKYYAFTREIRNGVNNVTAAVLGTVWYIAKTKPTKVEGDRAVWGPYTDALEPATWRFSITRISGEEYAYQLEGRSKDSTSESAYLTVLSGTGYGRKDSRHGDGAFTIDLDASKSLDPFTHEQDSGTVTVTHDLPPTVTRELNPLPRQIEVALAPSSSASRMDILSLAREDNTGRLVIDGTADVDESHATALEDITIVSQWNATGAGRADVAIASGDVPAALGSVTAVECWDSRFRQSYYADSAKLAPDAGNAAACAFATGTAAE